MIVIAQCSGSTTLFFYQQFFCFYFKQIIVKMLESDNKATLVLIFFPENRSCGENFKCGQQITCKKSFFVKLKDESRMPRFLARHYKYIFSQLYLLSIKCFLLYFLFSVLSCCKIFSRMCFLTRKSGEKECILQID